ncbi:MAG: type I restriction-modification system subunit M N-terminal domain-containing protein [Mollicutes bacterium UO1]
MEVGNSYKDIALSTFFLLAVNKKYESKLEKETNADPNLPKEIIAEERSFFTIWVPPEARLEYLKQHLNNDFKTNVSKALKLLEEANPYWLREASFANLFTNPDLSNQLLINVFQELDNLN